MAQELSLFDRQREYYENATRRYLPRRTHVVIRADGVSFSKFTRQFEKPYDLEFIRCMDAAAIALCKKAQNVKFGFVQSDEISIVMGDYATLNTSAWFANEERKLNSCSAGIVTAGFAEALLEHEGCYNLDNGLPYFDARAWIIPELEEVINYFLSRQSDCTRNSLSSVAQVLYSAKELHQKGFKELNQMVYEKRNELREILLQTGVIRYNTNYELYEKEDLNWDDIPVGMKRGRIIIKESYQVGDVNSETGFTTRNRWVAKPAPIFSELGTRTMLKNLFTPIDETISDENQSA